MFQMALNVAQGVGKLSDTLDKNTPKLEEYASVTVYGNPDASLSELYFIAMSLGFGAVRRRDINRAAPPNGMIKVSYDTTEKAVTFTIHQVTSYKSFAATIKTVGTPQVLAGPPDVFKGGPFDWDSALPGVPGGGRGTGIPLFGFGPGVATSTFGKLFYEGKTILTNKSTVDDAGLSRFRPADSPAPPGDDLSRSTAVTAEKAPINSVGTFDKTNWRRYPNFLLYSALEAPCRTTGKTYQKPEPGTFAETQGAKFTDPAHQHYESGNLPSRLE